MPLAEETPITPEICLPAPSHTVSSGSLNCDGFVAARPEITERKVASALDELVRAGFVLRYDLTNRVFLQIARWFDLQGKRGQRRTYASRYPAPPGWPSDWVNTGERDDEVPAPGGRGARHLRPPLPLSSPSSSTPPFTGLGSPPVAAGAIGRTGDLVEKARRGQLTHEDAFELGASLVDAEQSARRVP